MFRDAINPWDWSRSYLLPDHVETTIPRRGSIGSYGAHNAARGLLVEICYATAATPIALQYTETEIREPDTTSHAIIVVVTATAELPDGTTVSAATRSRQHPRPRSRQRLDDPAQRNRPGRRGPPLPALTTVPGTACRLVPPSAQIPTARMKCLAEETPWGSSAFAGPGVAGRRRPKVSTTRRGERR